MRRRPCFEPDSIAEYERRRQAFRARRDYLVPALNALGLTVPVEPDGAFFAWADCSAHCSKNRAHLPGGSWDFVFDLMRRAQVAMTPGRDFGRHAPARYVRLSYASSMDHLQQAMDRLQRVL